MLLDSPLGRQFLVGYLDIGESPFESGLFEQLGLGSVSGSSVQLTAGRVWPRRLRRPRRSLRSRSWRDVSAAEVRALIGAAVAREQWRELAGMGELELLADLATFTYRFGFGGGDEVVWALTALAKEELRPIADALVLAPATRRWWEPAGLADQRFVEWDGPDWPRLSGASIEQAVHAAAQESRERNAEGLRSGRPREREGTSIGACWWSAPEFADRSWTTSAFGDAPSVALFGFINSFAPVQDTGATVWSLRMDAQARVLEITGPADWQRLVSEFPQDVTGTHDGEWRDWGVPGPWRLPDWEQVMERYDGVHVTIGGYVASCGLALPADGGYTMLAGWIPGATAWFRDCTTGATRLGRWQGSPGGSRGWDDLRDEWTPDG